MTKRKLSQDEQTATSSADSQASTDRDSASEASGVEQTANEQSNSGKTNPVEAEDTGDDSLKECVVIGVGASAGGLEAYKHLLRSMPDDTGMAFVLIQHLDPTHESLMVELLSKYTSMPVLQVQNAMPIQPNHVYMIPPNKFITLKGGGLFLEDPVTKRGVRLPIDHFFRSLAAVRKERSICIVLSGTGSDGADGLRDVKAEGGMTIAQQPESAQYDGMPRSAISTGAVDFILPIEDMVEVVVPYARHPYVLARPTATLADRAPDHFRAIVSLLRAHTDQDFTHYKKGTLTRRIERRMGIRQINEPAGYLALLRQDNDEVQSLFKDMLIGVTRFFRDTAAWDRLTDILTAVILERRNEEPVRVWVPGCSTGEEAYSIAMLLFELQERQNKRLETQVFATDIDGNAIDVARLGIYPDGITNDITDERIDKWFNREGEKLRVKKRLRESCVFATQNLLSDPPFSNLDLISCRNLLIYLESEIQQRIFDMLHFALKPNGLLFLGSSESPAQRKKLFKTLSQESRIYRKLGESQIGGSGVPVRGKNYTSRNEKALSTTSSGASVGTVERSKRALLEQFAPASVVVDHRGMIQYIHGPVRNYLDFPVGEPVLDLAAMALDGLKARTRSCLQQARSTNETISAVAPRIRRDSRHIAVRIRVQPLAAGKGSEPLYLVSFLDEVSATDPQPSSKTSTNDAGEEPVVVADEVAAAEMDRQLTLELQATREDLQSTIEELESSNEELKASSEEVMSMNEELQSTNEELETSREELQSLNEELSTVNSQLHDKVEELEGTTNDLTNLLTSTDMATLFLDPDLRIRRFTPATMRLMSLLNTDIGRPLSDLAPRVEDADLVSDAQEVLANLTPVEKEVANGSGHSFIRRITPFRTSDNKIEGIVITFSDVTSLKLASKRLELRERQQAVIAQLGRAALAGDDLQSLFERAVREIADTLEVAYAKVLRMEPDRKRLRLLAGVGWQEGLVGDATVPSGIESQAGYTLQSASAVIVDDLRTEKRFSGPQLLTDHGVVSGMSVIIGPESNPWGVLGTHARENIQFTVDDTNFVTAVANLLWEAIRRDSVEATLRDNEARLAAFLRNSAVVGWMKDDQGKYVYWSETLARRFDRSAEHCIGKTDDEIWPPEVAKQLRANDAQVRDRGESIELMENVPAPNGEPGLFLVSKFPFIDAAGKRYVGGLGVDVTQRVKAEEALAASQSRLQNLVDSASVGIAFAKPDGTVLQANDAMLKIFSITREEFEQEGWDWQDRVLPEDKRFAAVMKRLGESNSTETIELKRKDANSSTVWVLASARPLDNDASQYVAFLVDITPQKKAELALVESEERLRVAANMAGFGTYYCDLTTGKVTWSNEYKAILGLKPDEPIEVELGAVPEFVHEEDRPRVATKINACLDPAGNGEFRDEHRIVRPDGEIRWILMQGRTMFRGNGEHRRPVHNAGVALDITERHRFEDELNDARHAAEAANEAKSQFLANMSHEIRTPLTAILGFADVLHTRVQDPEDLASINTIKENGDHLCQILNDILDLAKIESGKMVARNEDCDIVSILTHMRSLMAVRATNKGLTLTIELNGDIPCTIQSDAKMLRQILLNLVGNAIKFTETGGIRLAVSCLREEQLLEIAVIDSGVGIEQEKLDVLFLPFEQVDNSATRVAEGTGLGLAISKHLAELLGAQMRVESALNKGSTFRLSIPTGSLDGVKLISDLSMDLAEQETGTLADQLPEISGRVLTVDDRREIRFLIEKLLESTGVDIVTASDGAQGLESWRENNQAGTPFDAILMDMQMPVMDGLEATRKLREQGYEGPVIALTANAMSTDRAKALQAGCNDFITKPIDRSQLIDKLYKWIDQAAGKSPPPPAL